MKCNKIVTLSVGNQLQTALVSEPADIMPPASIADAPARSSAQRGWRASLPFYLGLAKSACRRTLTTASPPKNCPLIARRRHEFCQLAAAAAVALIALPCRAIAPCPRPVIRRKSKRASSACGWCGLAPIPTRKCYGFATRRCRGAPFSIG